MSDNRYSVYSNSAILNPALSGPWRTSARRRFTPRPLPFKYSGILLLYIRQRALHLVAAQVLVVQSFEPPAELLSRRSFRRSAGVQLRCLHYLLGHVDRAIGPERQRNCIGGPRVHGQRLVSLAQP